MCSRAVVFQRDTIVDMNCEPASVMIMVECDHPWNDFGKRLTVRNVFLFALGSWNGRKRSSKSKTSVIKLRIL